REAGAAGGVRGAEQPARPAARCARAPGDQPCREPAGDPRHGVRRSWRARAWRHPAGARRERHHAAGVRVRPGGGAHAPSRGGVFGRNRCAAVAHGHERGIVAGGTGDPGAAAGARGLGSAGTLQWPALDARTGRSAVMRLVGRRLLMTLPTLFGVLVVACLLLNVAPGDPVAAVVGERADSATIARLRAELHLDDPIPAQFGRYVWAVMHGDLGRSYITQRPIAQDLAARFPKTVQLALAAMALAALWGITLGVLSAIRPGEAVDR